jgi:hypothetical protein
MAMDSNLSCLVLPTPSSDTNYIAYINLSDYESVLEVNCVGSWSLGTCYLANVLGLVSTALWFTVLLPQVLKNFWRRSVDGLSFLWGLANFTASLVNIFFIFNLSLPYYVRVEGVYQPLLEITILLQFLLFFKEPFHRKLLILALCLVLWGIIVELQLNIDGVYVHLEWVSICLWSIETYPQVILNLNRRSTSGQSTISVLITIFGKTTDFLSTYGLSLPIQYVIMAYFSSTAGLINGFQLFWYGRKMWLKDGCFTCQRPKPCCVQSKTVSLTPAFVSRREQEGSMLLSEDNVCSDEEEVNSVESRGHSLPHRGGNSPKPHHVDKVLNRIEEEESVRPLNGLQSGDGGMDLEGGLSTDIGSDPDEDPVKDTAAEQDRFHKLMSNCRKVLINAACVLGMLYCSAGVCFFAVAFWWKTQSLWAITGPVACIIILVLAYVYRFVNEKGHLGKLSCYQIVSLKFKELWQYL